VSIFFTLKFGPVFSFNLSVKILKIKEKNGGPNMKQGFALFINTEINFSKGFSFDELVHKTKLLFEHEGIPGFLSMVLLWLDQILIMKYKGESKHNCCKECYLYLNRKEEKSLHTSCGRVKFHWSRLRCKSCGKSFVPLKRFLKLENFVRKTNELEEIVIDILSEQSFRRVSNAIHKISGTKIPHTSLHTWFMSTKSDEIAKNKRVQTLIPDGTGYKKHPKYGGCEQYTNKEVRVVLGITKEGVVVPYGGWTESTWDEISREIKQANHSNPNVYFKPIADLLVSDGEEGMIRAMRRLTKQQQRCQWHLYKDLYQPLRIGDEASLLELRRKQHELAQILEIKLPESDFDKVTLEQKLELEKSVFKAEKALVNFINDLVDKGYTSAATYVLNAKEKMFSYVKLWLKTGLKNPRVSSLIERLMREIGRRIKKIGYNWSPKGAEKMTNIIIKKVTAAKEWDEWWKKKLNFTGSVNLSFQGCVPV
jgi:hypothetical protein